MAFGSSSVWSGELELSSDRVSRLMGAGAIKIDS